MPVQVDTCNCNREPEHIVKAFQETVLQELQEQLGPGDLVIAIGSYAESGFKPLTWARRSHDILVGTRVAVPRRTGAMCISHQDILTGTRQWQSRLSHPKARSWCSP